MQSLSISEITEKKSPSITGYLFIKRNIFWGERYVRMNDGKLSYYEEKTDTTPKGVLILQNAEVVEKYGGKDNVILLKVRYGPIPELLIKIEKPLFRTKFMRCLYDNIKGEEKNGKQIKDLSFEGLEDPTHNDYPPLPDQYKIYYNKRFQLGESIGNELVFVQGNEGNSKSKSDKSVQKNEGFFAGLLIGGLLVSLASALNHIVINAGILTLFVIMILVSKRKSAPKSKESQMIRRECVVPNELDEIFNIIQNMRSSLYLKDEVKFIFNEELYFQENNKYFLIEKDINKLRYLWEFIPSDSNRTLVSIIYSIDNPEISLSVLEHLVYKGKALDFTAKTPLKKRNQNQSTFSPSTSQIRSKSVLPIVPISSMKEMECEDDTVIAREKSSFLPSLTEMKELYPKIPETLLQQITASRRTFTQTLNMTYDRTQSKNSCEMSVREMDGGLMVTKGVTTLKGDVEEIVKYVRDLEKRQEYDGMFNSGKVLQQFQISMVLYQKFNGIFPVSPRDFVLLLTEEKLEDGIMIHGKSTRFLQHAGDGKSVRGQVLSAGFLIKNVGGGNVEITYLTYSDPAGKLPDMIKKKAGNMQSGVIMKIRENLLKKFKQ